MESIGFAEILDAISGMNFCTTQAWINNPHRTASRIQILMNSFDCVLSTVAGRDYFNSQIRGANYRRTISLYALKFLSGHESDVWSTCGIAGQPEFCFHRDPSQPMRFGAPWFRQLASALGGVVVFKASRVPTRAPTRQSCISGNSLPVLPSDRIS